ncbi:MAG: glycosyltransferase [Planctomycetes bacterium]|nr:glycosyltransferase [Planctomycetota bacterium]
MGIIFDRIVLVLFFVSTCALAVYGVHLYVLLYLFHRRRKSKIVEQRRLIEDYRTRTPEADWPGVTTQLPIYNEADVATRVIEAVAAMDYPRGKHQIQVLDDSTDETRLLVDMTVRRLRSQGVDVEAVRREKRTGYKAGALREGLSRCRHPLVAIFDADFIPPKDFLRRAVPFLAGDEKLACVQGRWTHLNQDESWLTRAQAVALDAHFAVEQGARAWNGLMMNFNGTAGVWRKAAIEDPAAGGWSADTLTEDLDLSYRVQLAGWRMDYCLELACPAELPNTISGLKAQQRRWATGGVQTAVKLLPRIWRSKVSFVEKLEASLHLTHYSVYLWTMVLALLARPLLAITGPLSLWWCFLMGWILIVFTILASPTVYGYARYHLGGGWSGVRHMPAVLVLGTGLSVNNAVAVLRGLRVRGGEFVRTPKSGSTQSTLLTSRYKARRSGGLWFFEMLLGAYCLANWAIYMTVSRPVLSVFLLIYALGFISVGWMSRPEASFRRRLVFEEEPVRRPTPFMPAAAAPGAMVGSN